MLWFWNNWNPLVLQFIINFPKNLDQIPAQVWMFQDKKIVDPFEFIFKNHNIESFQFLFVFELHLWS
jgi:hypothetical protein